MLGWTYSNDGKYYIKSGYQIWHDHHIGSRNIPQSNSWSKMWRLNIPPKLKNLFVKIMHEQHPYT